jgi:hypothetical protein
MLHFLAVNAETNAHTQGSTIKCCISLLSTQKQMRTLRESLFNVAFPLRYLQPHAPFAGEAAHTKVCADSNSCRIFRRVRRD